MIRRTILLSAARYPVTRPSRLLFRHRVLAALSFLPRGHTWVMGLQWQLRTKRPPGATLAKARGHVVRAAPEGVVFAEDETLRSYVRWGQAETRLALALEAK